MADLEALQAMLAASQTEVAQYKLSNMNVIGLLLKLEASGKLDVIHSSSGKEFITPSQLEKEIQEEIVASGGRMTIADVQVRCEDIDSKICCKRPLSLRSRS
jgi:hypothetical protein